MWYNHIQENRLTAAYETIINQLNFSIQNYVKPI